MADHDIDICDDWNGSQGNNVTWTNNTGAGLHHQPGRQQPWPFKDGPPIPATGSIPPGGWRSAADAPRVCLRTGVDRSACARVFNQRRVELSEKLPLQVASGVVAWTEKSFTNIQTHISETTP
jgi:hypothetical protein